MTDDTFTYEGTRTPFHGLTVLAINDRTGWREYLPPRSDLVNHSPDGFECGYGGSGPLQLAFALVYHATGGNLEEALATYKRFCARVVAHLPKNAWVLEQDTILRFSRRN